MLRLRLVRTGCTNKQTFRIVVADHHKAVKKKFVESLGYYLPTRDPKILELNEERVKYWISKGAMPTDTAASLFKSKGMDGMDAFLEPRDKKKRKKSEIKADAKGEQQPRSEAKVPSDESSAKTEKNTEEVKAETPKAEAPKEAEPKTEAPKEEPKAPEEEQKPSE